MTNLPYMKRALAMAGNPERTSDRLALCIGPLSWDMAKSLPPTVPCACIPPGEPFDLFDWSSVGKFPCVDVHCDQAKESLVEIAAMICLEHGAPRVYAMDFDRFEWFFTAK